MEKPHYRVLGIDHGTVRIGIAMSDETATIAFGKEAIPNDSKSISRIIELARDFNAVKIIVGYPLNLKGNKTVQTETVDKFISSLKELLQKNSVDAEVIQWDERFTSKMALDSTLESGMKKKNRQDKKNLDIISAAIMLQSYLDSKISGM